MQPNASHRYLGENRFGGSIPPELGNLQNVIRLTINNCLLSGAIPPEIGNLTSVQYLDLSHNQNMNGTLPPEIGNCLNLTTL
ncbi:hypothetical protein CBR_g50156 [Chara braunii]|uniref:Leucine-rich repeat-containing N-terminal plant-type domain-containing protein n=1 Tax=Chara braunii TaxID=69332 RepID=A0A388M6F8_CHABU|nr:hypothetical protein CBR_g50156 [Chara braunii]|eukprot:GBG90063.1 hypothetical protein CBR_g50156 [Chara braunii]